MSSFDPASRRNVVARAPCICVPLVFLAVMVSACGFQLRGTGGSGVLPASLSTVRVHMGGVSSNEPIAQSVRDALTQAGAKVVATGDVPVLALEGETTDSQVASVRTTTGKASEYVLRYSVSFRVQGPQPVALQTIRLQRDYSFDPERVLAKEQEERELLANMRREAAQQIVARVARALGESR